MGYSWGRSSKQKIRTLDPRWVEILDALIEATQFDVTIVWAHRGEAEQNTAFANKASTLKWPMSKHNQYPSPAVDLAPWSTAIQPAGIDWNDTRYFLVLAGMVIGIAKQLGYKVRWGGNWDGDAVIIDDQSLADLCHFELTD